LLKDYIKVTEKINQIMSLDKAKKNIESLREKIRYFDYCYYILSEPETSDKEYDNLVKELKDLEKKYPQLITSDSPTQRVSGGVTSGFAAVKHKVKMQSLDNTYSVEELKGWQEKLKRIIKRDVTINYIVEPKIDGVSCSLIYEDGVLNLGLTRGDGEIGEDVSANIKTIKSIPLKLRGDFPRALEVRGEVYMKKNDFEQINETRISIGESPFANPRNATSGSLKMLDPSLVAQRNLCCFIHSFGWSQGYDFKTHKEFLNKIKEWGLCVNTYSKECKNIGEVIDYCLKLQERRDNFNYAIDGMVIKVNRLSLQKELGATLKSPRWAVAYKFPAHQVTTIVKNVEFGVGRTGIITPVAILKPVECGGVIISRTTLHNFDEIKRLDIREGDCVLVERAGDVIPKVVKVIISQRPKDAKKIKIVNRCPTCNEKVTKEKEEEVYLYCSNPNCPAQLKRSLLHFSSRVAMDIEGLGESVIELLVNRRMLKSLIDIYKLKKKDLLSLPLFKDKKAINLISAIEKSKKRPLSKFLYGLGIRHVGEKAAITLAENFKNIEAVLNVEESDLLKIQEIGPTMAASIVRFFSSLKVKKMIAEFKKVGINTQQVQTGKKRKSAIANKVFIFTGELQSLSRNQAQDLLRELGAKWTSVVSKNIDFVVVGKNPGSKHAKAKKLSLLIINESQFKDLVQK